MLSRCPFAAVESVTVSVVDGVPEARSGEPAVRENQSTDPSLKIIFEFLEERQLPPDEVAARELTASRSQNAVLDGVLYHVEPDKTLRLIPTAPDRRRLFEDVHGGAFGGHLRDAKVHSQLSRHYWWKGMSSDIGSWCRSCLVCASRRVGTPIRPPLVPIPVAGAFDRVGVDVIQLQLSQKGNKYASVYGLLD